MKKFLMIAAMAMFATVACDKPSTGTEGTKQDVTIAAAPASVQIAKGGKLTATVAAAATADITITVKSSNDAALTVANEIKIATGSTTGSIDFTGKTAGKTTLSFTSANANVKTASVEITVTPATVSSLKTYCEPEFPTYKQYARLDGAKVGLISLPATEGNDYFDYAHEGTNKATLTDGMNIVITYANIDSGAADPYGVGVYVDWNNDGDFEDAGEVIGTKEFKAGAADATQDLTITLATIPADAVFPTTMRILSTLSDKDLGNAVPKDGCGFVESGSAYDIEVSK